MTARQTRPDQKLNGTEIVAQSSAADLTRHEAPTGRFHREADAPHSPEEAEAQYVAARTVWVDAMHNASTGKPADLASLAIAQEAYERAAIERTRWQNGPKAHVAVEPPPKRNVEIALGQELAWRRVREAEARRKTGVMGRLFGRRSRD
jgi:hypothetical protein